MFPSIKKNLFQDKVENQKATFGIGMKRALLGLVVGSVISFASTTMPSSTVDNIVSVQDEFILEPSTSLIDTSRNHHSHSSHRSHHSHYSSRY